MLMMGTLTKDGMEGICHEIDHLTALLRDSGMPVSLIVKREQHAQWEMIPTRKRGGTISRWAFSHKHTGG